MFVTLPDHTSTSYYPYCFQERKGRVRSVKWLRFAPSGAALFWGALSPAVSILVGRGAALCVCVCLITAVVRQATIVDLSRVRRGAGLPFNFVGAVWRWSSAHLDGDGDIGREAKSENSRDLHVKRCLEQIVKKSVMRNHIQEERTVALPPFISRMNSDSPLCYMRPREGYSVSCTSQFLYVTIIQ